MYVTSGAAGVGALLCRLHLGFCVARAAFIVEARLERVESSLELEERETGRA